MFKNIEIFKRYQSVTYIVWLVCVYAATDKIFYCDSVSSVASTLIGLQHKAYVNSQTISGFIFALLGCISCV